MPALLSRNCFLLLAFTDHTPFLSPHFYYLSHRLPDAFIVGAAKSGTTSLYQMLLEHPQVFFPSSKKEPMFFCFDGIKMPDEIKELNEEFKDQAVRNPNDYFDLYKAAEEGQVAIDGTTSYLYRHATTISSMKRHYGDRLQEVKIIIMLRNPVDRAWSHYNFLIRNGFEDLPFAEAINRDTMARRKLHRWGFDYLGFGAYSDQIKAFKEQFPLMRVYLTEDLKAHESVLSEIYDFLDLPPVAPPAMKQANPSGIPKNKFVVDQMRNNRLLKRMVNLFPERTKHLILEKRDQMMMKFLKKPMLADDIRAELTDYYRDEIKELGQLINRDLSHWLKPPRP